MTAEGIVVAVAETESVRETLAIVLEDVCDLRFGGPGPMPISDLTIADVAVVAVTDPSAALADLQREWPQLPVVAVEMPARRQGTGVPTPAAPAVPGVYRVALEPHTIRDAVLECLPCTVSVDPGAPVREVVEPLRAELAYALRALRTFSTLHATRPGPDTHALLGTVMREQSHVIADSVEHMARYCGRPRHSLMSTEFLAAIRAALEGSDAEPGARSVVCRWAPPSSRPPAGPLALAPLVADYLLDHLRRNGAAAIVDAHAGTTALTLGYRPHRFVPGGTLPWVLALGDFALRPWGWRIVLGGSAARVTVTVGPGA